MLNSAFSPNSYAKHMATVEGCQRGSRFSVLCHFLCLVIRIAVMSEFPGHPFTALTYNSIPRTLKLS